MNSPVVEAGKVVKNVDDKFVRLERGDLTALPVDAIVFYAREDLALGTGFGTAIQSRGGAQVKKELESLGRVAKGDAVITGGGGLPARHIIHACGPKFQEPDTEAKLHRTVEAALETAAGANLATVAFPAMGTGFYGIPLELCSAIMLDVISRYLKKPTSLHEIVICVTDNREFRAFQSKLEAL